MSSQARVKFESDMEEIAESISVVNTFVHVGEKIARHENARRTRTAPECILKDIAEAAQSKTCEACDGLANDNSENVAMQTDARTVFATGMDEQCFDNGLDVASLASQNVNCCDDLRPPMVPLRTFDIVEGSFACSDRKIHDALQPDRYILQEVPCAVFFPSQAAQTAVQMVAVPETSTRMSAPAATLSSMTVPSSAPPEYNPRPSQESGPRLLGRTSLSSCEAVTCKREQRPTKMPMVQMVQRPSEFAQPTMSSVLKCELTSSGKEVISWNVDGRKLESLYKQMLSPEFDLKVPSIGAMPFRLMILAKETKGKGGRSFQKAGGQGRIFVKCEASLPSEAPRLTFHVSIRCRGAEVSKGPFSHQFVEQNCGPLQNDGEAWDLLPMMDRSSKRFMLCVEVL